jgi:glutamate dehydrogenase/leucine dehydrogenase
MVTDHPDYSEHELVAFCRNVDADLTAITALHDTGAGPAMGGCRMARYPAIDDALTDVLRLSKGHELQEHHGRAALRWRKSRDCGRSPDRERL